MFHTALRISTFTVLTCFLSVGVLFGETFYVATTGDDATGDGSSSSPWATIQEAVLQVSDGDEIIVRPGFYNGQNVISRQFVNGITIRSEAPYQAELEFNGPVIVGTNCQGMHFEGFLFQQRTGFPQDNLVMLTGATQRVTFNNNIFREAVRLSLLHVGPGNDGLTVTNNMFYNAGLQTDSSHVRVEGGTNVLISDNVFFNDYDSSVRNNTNNSGAFVYITNPTHIAGVQNIRIRRNIMFHWQGLDNRSMIQLGTRENFDPERLRDYDAENVLIENNLLLGDNPLQIRSYITMENASNITVNNNTFSGDSPTLTYGFYLISSEPDMLNEDIVFTNNIWSDHTGTMGGRTGEGRLDFCDCLPLFTRQAFLINNLYFNGDNPLPFDADELLNPEADPSLIVGDPLLGVPENITYPVFNGTSFAGGTSTIREAFVALAESYGRLGDGSPAIGRGGAGPADDLLGNLRGGTADVGAMEFQACSGAGDLNNDTAINQTDFLLLVAAWAENQLVGDLNNDGRVTVLDGASFRNIFEGCGSSLP